MRKYGSVYMVFLLTVVFYACQNHGSDTAAADSAVHSHGVVADSAQSEPAQKTITDSVSVYTGILPCADCESVETSLSLYSDNRFQLHRLYYGRKSKGPGSNEMTDTGTWMAHGADMIHLQGLKDQPSMYIRTDSSLIQLDMQGKRIEGKLADKYILKKMN